MSSTKGEIAVTAEQQNDFASRRASMLERLRSTPDLADWCELHTDLIDGIVRSVFTAVASQYPAPPISVVATGGYGRREMAPYSDVDLTVVPSDDAAIGLDPFIRAFFRALHATIGSGLRMEIGYAYRLVNDAPGLDETSRTGLLDSRLVAGSAEPWDALMHQFWESFPVAEFLIAKLEERRAGFAKFNDTPLVVEPEIKEGAGGLRCFQTANWIRMAIGERPMRRSRAYLWMLRMRNQLHLVAGRKQDQASRQRQAEISDLIGTDPYRLMSDCAEHGGSLYEEFLLARERLFDARFALGGGIMAVRGEARSVVIDSASSAGVGVARATQLGLRVAEEAFRTGGQVDGGEALLAISAGESSLRNLDRCGLLEQLLPEITRCKTLIPRDSVHKYTVYEHTFRAVGILDRLAPDSYLGIVKAGLRDVSPLYLALLLHDAGKFAEGQRPHSVSGAEYARGVCQRWGLAPSLAAVVEWLVAEHLAMDHFIRLRDPRHPQTALEFAKIVGDQERLDLLTLLTYCDVNAVSPEAWSPSQDASLPELHRQTTKLFEGEIAAEEDPSVHRKRLLRELRNHEVPQAEVFAFLEAMPAHYLVSTPPALVQLHIRYEQQAKRGKPVIEIENETALNSSEMTVCCLDRPGLLSQVLGVVYAYDLTIHEVRASTSNSDPAVALDVLNISFGGKILPTATAQRLIAGLRSILAGEKDYEILLRERGKDPLRKQENFSYTFIEGSPSILEVQAPRGRGMAFRISRLISSQGWNISAARVGQWAGRAAAAFYISGPNHMGLKRGEVARVMAADGAGDARTR